MNGTKTGQNESQATAMGSNDTHIETNGTAGSSDTHTETNGTTGINETHTQTSGTIGSNETHGETGSSETPMHGDGTKTGKNESRTETDGPKTENNATGAVSNSTQSSNINQTTGNNKTRTEMDGSKTGNNETGTVSSSTQSSKANQTAGAAPHDSPADPPPMLSIFLVNDLQYDIFPVHPENGSMCDTDPGKYPSMGFDVQMAMRIEVSSRDVIPCNLVSGYQSSVGPWCSLLMISVLRSSEMLLLVYQNTWHYCPEDH